MSKAINCNSGIKSCGIVCVYPSNNTDGESKVLIVRRRDSFAYMNLLRGRGANFEEMTREEINILKNYSFYQVMRDYLLNKKLSDDEFYRIKNYYYRNVNKLRNMYISDETFARNERNMWGLPKGQMEKGETYIECAEREFKEETMLEDVSYSPLTIDNSFIVDTYYGSKIYKSLYYISYTNELYYTHNYIRLNNRIRRCFISNEVSEMKWVSKQDIEQYYSNHTLDHLHHYLH